MINPKNICISACIGFFLSFFIGLFSDVRFSQVLLRAALFALLFALLCVGITFLYQKFLSTDNGGFSADAEPQLQRTAGGVVNIVVDDSNLADDGMSPKFTVLNNHADLKQEPEESPVAETNAQSGVREVPSEDSDSLYQSSPAEGRAEPAPVQAQPAAASPAAEPASFKPMGLGEVTHGAPAQGSGGMQLDELPDVSTMNMFDAEGEGSSQNSDDGIETDTEFSTGGKSVKEQPISGDTNVMAKAIQTLLAKDN